MFRLPKEIVLAILSCLPYQYKPRCREVCQSWCLWLDQINSMSWWELERVDIPRLRKTSNLASLMWLEDRTKLISQTIKIRISSFTKVEFIPWFFELFIKRADVSESEVLSFFQFAIGRCNLPLLQQLYVINSMQTPSFNDFALKFGKRFNLESIICILEAVEDVKLTKEVMQVLIDDMKWFASLPYIRGTNIEDRLCMMVNNNVLLAELLWDEKLISCYKVLNCCEKLPTSFETIKRIILKIPKREWTRLSLSGRVLAVNNTRIETFDEFKWISNVCYQVEGIENYNMGEEQGALITFLRIIPKCSPYLSECLDYLENLFGKEIAILDAGRFHNIADIDCEQKLQWLFSKTRFNPVIFISRKYNVNYECFMHLYDNYDLTQFAGVSINDFDPRQYITGTLSLNFLRWYRLRFPNLPITIRSEYINSSDLGDWEKFVDSMPTSLLNTGETHWLSHELPYRTYSLLYRIWKNWNSATLIDGLCPQFIDINDMIRRFKFYSTTAFIWVYDNIPECRQARIESSCPAIAIGSPVRLWLMSKYTIIDDEL